MQQLELKSLNCMSCGANLTDFVGKTEIKCEYCGKEMKILRPSQVIMTQGKLEESNYNRLQNLVEILQKSLSAGNYKEAYDYCNKALEINPSIGSLWENKAICAFYLSFSYLNEDKISNTNAREIKSYLNASKENDPNSETYASTADAIGANLASILIFKISLLTLSSIVLQNNKKVYVYDETNVQAYKRYLETLETAFEIMISKDYEILRYLVNQYSNKGRGIWWVAINKYGSNDSSNATPGGLSSKLNLDVQNKIQILTNKIRSNDPNYVPPEINVEVQSKGAIIFGIILIIVMIIVTISSQNK